MSADAKHVYTLIAYRPDALDACRGQVYARSSSEMEVQCFGSESALVEGWAQLRMKSRKAAEAPEVSLVEFTLLIDGLDYDGWWRLRGDEGTEEPPFDALERAARSRETELLAEQARAEQAQQQALAAEQRRKSRRAAVAAARAARAHYLALHAKYGPKGL